MKIIYNYIFKFKTNQTALKTKTERDSQYNFKNQNYSNCSIVQ